MVKNPLRKRYLRDLKSDLGKYLVIFLLLVFSIAEISGFLVAAESMLAAYYESFEKYNVEDGNFTVGKKLTQRQLQAIEALGVSVYDLQFTDRTFEGGDTLRIFPMRTQVNMACLMQGEFPKTADEIAIDRMYADNNSLKVGDTLTMEGGRQYRISGLVALSDYSTMFQNNSDMMFDAKTFGVAVVSPESFSGFDQDILTWRYAWKYNVSPESESQENDMSEDFLKGLTDIVSLEDYIPRYQNQAIIFTGEDFGGDRAMMMILLYVIIVIIAFVFGVTISNTIANESTVIGTLRATGYTRGELIKHYMTMPLIVTLVAAVIGNVLGYSLLKDVNADLYYGSYSLPTFVTLWNANAFLETTVIPLILMILITWGVLAKRLRLSPLRFIRRDLKSGKSRGAVPLSSKIPFFTRFRTRIFMQNIGNYAVLLVGIAFANLLLMFGMALPDVLDNYKEALPQSMFCEHQYMLQIPAGAINEDNKLESLISMMLFQKAVETDNPDAEKFSAYSLDTVPTAGYLGDEIVLFGVSPDSRYLDMRFDGSKVKVSSLYADKWGIKPGDTISLKEAYSDDTYSFEVDGIYPYKGALCVFMDREALNDTFGLGTGTFAGYFSASEITDIDEKYIGQEVDFNSLSKVSRQLQISMGEMMKVVQVFAVLIYVILIYLLSKTIIEKNAQSISLVKILGYTNAEAARLYVLVTSILVLIFLLITIPFDLWLLKYLFNVMVRLEMKGWIPFDISREVFIKMFIYGVVSYGVIALFEYRKVSKVPMEEALKNVE